MSTIREPDAPAAARQRTLVLVHGGGHQPAAPALRQLWLGALQHALQRDHDTSLDGLSVEFVYYADLTDAILDDAERHDATLDLEDRDNALRQLMALDSAKRFRRSRYESVPGQSPVAEFMADVGAPLSRVLGLGARRIARVLPELAAYWMPESGYRKAILERIVGALAPALARGDRLLVISHGLGCICVYDAFLALSPPTRPATRIDEWITLGTPIADDYVRKRVTGGPRAYPNLLVNWHNVSAEDDPHCHDKTVANDFGPMLEQRLISRIRDHYIYNLAERFGRSDPHDPLGYLINPKVGDLVHEWLTSANGT